MQGLSFFVVYHSVVNRGGKKDPSVGVLILLCYVLLEVTISDKVGFNHFRLSLSLSLSSKDVTACDLYTSTD